MVRKESLLSITDLTNEEILTLIQKAQIIEKNPEQFVDQAKGKILALLFFESSTRTYFSFASAIQRLDGNFIGFSNSQTTSSAKGESLEDTARVMSFYADLLVVRHAEHGSLKRIQSAASVPVINAGEGQMEHPTQALADLYTIQKHFGYLKGITIVLYGDLKFGRTNHSLLLAGARLGANFICIAPDELQMPTEYLHAAQKSGAEITLQNDIHTAFNKMDVLYVSRLQKERLPIGLNYEKLRQQFLVNEDTLKHLKPDAIIMHPLPRVGEIDSHIDQDPRAKYFEQAKNAVFVRMAIILAFLSPVF